MKLAIVVWRCRCIKRSPDTQKVDGLYLGKNVVDEASRGLTKVLTMIAPRVLDVGQMTQYIWTQLRRRWYPKIKLFRPSFDECLDHVLIHAGILMDEGDSIA